MKQPSSKLKKQDDTPSLEEPAEFASPPCLRHEIDPAYGGDVIEDDMEPLPTDETPETNKFPGC